jgi:hypothetical protein
MYQKDHQTCSQQHDSPQMAISISFVPGYTCLILFIGNFICLATLSVITLMTSIIIKALSKLE